MRVAHEIGFPVLIKATAGGGGNGMRVAGNDLALKARPAAGRRPRPRPRSATPASTWRSTSSGRGTSRCRSSPTTTATSCTSGSATARTQRRHQKLIEESPGRPLRRKRARAMCEAAVRLIKAAGYTNAGTVEFIVDQTDNFYFIEVNARIQVEHPVTEMVTGIDLIKTQIRVAAGEPLPFTQDDIQCHGRGDRVPHQRRGPRAATSSPPPARSSSSSRPAAPACASIRTPTRGYTVPPYYDSMIGKLIVHADHAPRSDRLHAAGPAGRCTSKASTPRSRCTRRSCATPRSSEARIDTTFVERTWLS